MIQIGNTPKRRVIWSINTWRHVQPLMEYKYIYLTLIRLAIIKKNQQSTPIVGKDVKKTWTFIYYSNLFIIWYKDFKEQFAITYWSCRHIFPLIQKSYLNLQILEQWSSRPEGSVSPQSLLGKQPFRPTELEISGAQQLLY